MKDESTEQWHIKLNIGDFGPRKATAEEVANHNDIRKRDILIRSVLEQMNELITSNSIELYQPEGEGDTGYTPAIQIDHRQTSIDNETGLFTLPDIGERWDENTIVSRMMFNSLSEGIHTFAITT